MFVNRAQPPPPASVNLVLQHGAKPCKVSIALFVDYSYYSSTIRGLFVLFVDYSRTIRTIRRLFADYSHYSSTIRGLFVLFVDYSHYSHYSLHYSSFINCRGFCLFGRAFDQLFFQKSNSLGLPGGGLIAVGFDSYTISFPEPAILGKEREALG